MSETLLGIIIGSIAGLVGGVVANILLYKNQKPISESSASVANTQANVALIAPLTARLNELEKEVQELREELKRRDEIIEAQNIGIGVLLTQIGRAHLTPEWKPQGVTLEPIKKSSGFGTR